MPVLYLDIFSFAYGANGISKPISLLAYCTAALLLYYVIKNHNERKKIKIAPKEERSKLVKATAERFHINMNKIPPEKLPDIVSKLLNNRIKTQIIVAIVILCFGLLIAFLASKEMDKSSTKQNSSDKIDSIISKNDLQNTSNPNATEQNLSKEEMLKAETIKIRLPNGDIESITIIPAFGNMDALIKGTQPIPGP